ncbi:MAG: folate family ECF transporter S component [Clostridia bacterium]|nr:folate family ECF transporter S component [Clostridia bacterium]
MKKFSVRYLAISGILIAISIILASNYCTFYITPAVRISFRDIPIIFASIYCGPLVGALAGLCADLIGTLVSGFGFYPLITVSAVLVGLIPGLVSRFLFKRSPKSFVSVAAGVFLSNILANMGWTTFSLHLLYARPVMELLLIRIPQYLIMAIAESYLIFALLKVTSRLDYTKMSYEQTVEYIHTITQRGSKLGLVRISELLKLLHNPEKKLKFVHVAGTNGKGSTAAMSASVLRAAGYKVGLFVSPYVVRFNERMQIDGEYIPDSELARIVSRIRPLAESMKVPPTEFELITATAFQYFHEHSCDIVVLEVGLGGEFDSTNVIETPEVATITAIGLDHTKILGDTVELVAKAKAGIIKDNGTVVFYGEDRAALPIIEEACKQHNSRLILPDFGRLQRISCDIHGQTLCYKDYKNLRLSLAGTYQIYNAAVVLETVAALRDGGWKISDKAVYEGMGSTLWPARFEIMSEKPLFIVDGGHNPMGVRGTMDTANTLFPDKKFKLIVGMMADKDVSSILDLILPKAKRVYTAAPDNPRSMPADELAKQIQGRGFQATACNSVEEATRIALHEAEESDIILATGSLYMAEAVRNTIETIKKEQQNA